MSTLKSIRWLWMNQGCLTQFSVQSCAHIASKPPVNPRQRNFGQPGNKHVVNQHRLQQRPDWLLKMHQSLLKGVSLPLPSQDDDFSNVYIQSCSTDSLISMMWNVTHRNRVPKSLMIELWRRMDSMEFEQILSVADILFMNNVQASWYLGSVTARFLEVNDVLEVTPSQLSRFVFHTLDRHRATPPNFIIALEEIITRSIDALNLDQLAVICRSFFTSKTRIRSIDLLDKIAVKLIRELDSLSPHYLPVFMKTFRYSNFVKISFYKDLGNVLVEKDYLKNFRTLGQIMHITFSYASVRVSHPVLFSYVLDTCCHPKYKFRVKDLAKLSWSCGTLVTDSPQDISTIWKVVTYLEHNLTLNAALHHPDNLVDLVNGLSFLNLHSDYLLNILFHPRSVSAVIEMAKTDESKLPQLSIIDSSLDIEYPDYTGNRLSEKSKQQIASLLGDFSVENEMTLKKGLREAVTALQQVLGEDKVSCTRVLPHMWTADICLVWDVVESKFISHQEETDQPSSKGKPHCLKLAIQILSNMQTTYDGKPLGMLHLKLRQLNTLGFVPVLIHAEEAHRFVYGGVQTTQGILLRTISKVVGTDLTHLLS